MSQQQNNNNNQHEKTQDSNKMQEDAFVDADLNSLVSMEFANLDDDVQAPEYNLAFNTNPYPNAHSGFDAQPPQQMGFQQLPVIQAPRLTELTGFDTSVPLASHVRANAINLGHHLAKNEKTRRVRAPYLGKPVMLEGTRRFVTATSDDTQSTGNCLALCDINGITLHDNPDPAIINCFELGNKCISWIHQRRGSQDDHYLYCAAGVSGDLDVYHITEGKTISLQSSVTIQEGYIRQMAFEDGLIASGGYCPNIFIHQETPGQLERVCRISMEGKDMSSLSLADAKASVHAGCLRYTLQHGEYVVRDFKRSGRRAAHITTGVPDLYCHYNMSDYLVALAGLDNTIRVYDIRQASNTTGCKQVEEVKLPDIGAIGCIERNSAGTALLVSGAKNVLTFRQAPGQNNAQYWARLENADSKSKAQFEASFANLQGENQHTSDSIIYTSTTGKVGVITHNYLFEEIPH